jgi:hypothetical protein
MHALGAGHGNLMIIVALLKLPCLREIRLSVHVVA